MPYSVEHALADYQNRFARRSCMIIGRGVTDFDYEQLATASDPVFFINDAVSLEHYCTCETFFFAHDAKLACWLNGAIRSTAVLSINSHLIDDFPGAVFKHRGKVVYYNWRPRTQKELLLRQTRDQIASSGELYHHSGTIHSVLHFVWLCGFSRIKLIGCDGIVLDHPHASVGGYDPRLRNLSCSTPATWQYNRIRRVQDLMIKLFGFNAEYMGTPVRDSSKLLAA